LETPGPPLRVETVEPRIIDFGDIDAQTLVQGQKECSAFVLA
jgi:hypothetical protein